MGGSAGVGKIVLKEDAVLNMTDKAEVNEFTWKWIYENSSITLSGSAKVKDYALIKMEHPVNKRLTING